MGTSDDPIREAMGANLFRLFLAGQTYVPEAADTYAEAAVETHAVTPGVQSLGAELHHEIGSAMAEILGTLHLALFRTAENLNTAGIALTEIAQGFSRSDDVARGKFSDLVNERGNQQLLADGPPLFVAPPRPGDPHGEAHAHIGTPDGWWNP